MTEAPTSVGELEENREQYEARMDEWDEAHESSSLGSALLPRAGASEMACRAYHELMMERGLNGIEYTQEALHQNGDYFDDFFDEVDEVIADFERFERLGQ